MVEEDTTSFAPHVLRQYAFLADGYRGALIGPMGDICWLCVPRWDSDAVFTNLLGGRGVYAITPTGARFVWGGFYENGSLIWNSRWVTSHGIVECREALAFPADPERAVLLRRIRAVDGPARVAVILDPRAGFGRRPLREPHREAGVWSGRTGDLHLRWTGAEHAHQGAGGELRADLRVPEGEHHDLVLELACRPFDVAPVDPATAWRTTEQSWLVTAPSLRGCIAHRDAIHAHTLLRGMTTPGGGMVAAATTSLPERAEAGRDYDYRYTWIRDQCYAGRAAAVAGLDDLLDAAVAFVTARLLADGPHLAPAYTAVGGRVPEEHPLPFLPGYPGSSVKVGNRVTGQFQLDAFGEALLLLAAAARRDRLDIDSWHALESAVDAIARRWREPDSGIWELPPRQWVHSKLVCVAGLKTAAGIAPARQAAHWSALADTVLAHTSRHGLHPSGHWQRAFDDRRVDAALLIPAIRGALAPDDPRTVATRAAVHTDLERDGYLYRFHQDQRPLGEAEGAFVMCGLMAALAAYQSGDEVEAVRWFERNRAACGSPGLYTEEYDIGQRQSRGNLPQAFVHALLLESAVTLSVPGSGRGGARTLP
ncbi:glycoside hydrolase family 15 protein [Streptosporangium sp. NPDC006930]|uniref:glycoside hydrolase family 15 protein n=1 Tax=unclassified Streptosporangium TaxID=2632669 RepID=UPI003425E662